MLTLRGPEVARDISQEVILPVGSGPRGRRFKSYRPDRFKVTRPGGNAGPFVFATIAARVHEHEDSQLAKGNDQSTGGKPLDSSPYRQESVKIKRVFD